MLDYVYIQDPNQLIQYDLSAIISNKDNEKLKKVKYKYKLY